MPSVDVSEDKDEVTVRAEVPGVTEKDLDLTWHDDACFMNSGIVGEQ
jgi:HSP20 family molecular chaperone IbpA